MSAYTPHSAWTTRHRIGHAASNCPPSPPSLHHGSTTLQMLLRSTYNILHSSASQFALTITINGLLFISYGSYQRY